MKETQSSAVLRPGNIIINAELSVVPCIRPKKIIAFDIIMSIS
jgi:hypothetical protein